MSTNDFDLLFSYILSQKTNEDSFLAFQKEFNKNPELLFQQDFKGNTLLMLAVYHGRTDIVQFLIEAGDSLSVVNNDKENVLHWCCWTDNSVDSLQLILNQCHKQQISLDAFNSDELSPLCLAILNGRHLQARMLIEAGANHHHTNSKGRNAFYYAMIHVSPLINDLIQAGADPKQPFYSTKNNVIFSYPLHLLCGAHSSDTSEHQKAVSILLKHLSPEDINQKDCDGSTALMKAARLHHYEIMVLLLQAGADPLIQDSSGFSAKDHFEQVANPWMDLDIHRSYADILESYCNQRLMQSSVNSLESPLNVLKKTHRL